MAGRNDALEAVSPRRRPLRASSRAALDAAFERALAAGDGVGGAHCVHERWMRGEMGVHIEAALDRLWAAAADSIPDWLPMRYVHFLPRIYDIAGTFEAEAGGRSHVYLILLDYTEDLADPYGVYVGMSRYPADQRFDQHKAGIRAAGSVLKRGLEPLIGPVLHLQHLKRAEAARIEEQLAAALAAAGLRVKGGH
jgi:hypothetical protein